jgi:hypothetical protein
VDIVKEQIRAMEAAMLTNIVMGHRVNVYQVGQGAIAKPVSIYGTVID